MKILLRIILIFLLTYYLSPYTPWWIGVFFSSLILFLLPTGSYLVVIISGFLSVSAAWLVEAWYIDFKTQSYLTEKIAPLFSINSAFLFVIIASLVGGICGVLGALTGASFRSIFLKKN